jgi:hypothetical protein
MTKLLLLSLLLATTATAQLKSPNEAGVAMGHLHIRAADIAPHEKFWTALLESAPRKNGNMLVYRYPGGVLLLQAMASSGGTAGSVVDHLGFQVKSLKRSLEPFCRQLEAQRIKFDVPFRKVPQLNLALAFLTDPWGTHIELTEGLGAW